jgi:hypothetical protein
LRLKQLEEQKGKLYKNLANKEDQARKLGSEGREKDRLVQDLENRLLEALDGRRHTVCIDRLTYEKDLFRRRKKENDEHEENTGLRNYLSRGLACP